MTIEKITIDQDTEAGRASWLKLRKADVTASVAGALLSEHPYQTGYGLWALKSGKIEADPEDSPAMKRGRLLEPVAVELLREERPTWSIARNTTYFRDPTIRLGATPDVLAIDPENGPGIIQVKSVEPGVFRRSWRQEDRSVEPPLWIIVQALVEAHLTGAKWAAVAALVVGFGIDLHIVPVPMHAPLIKKIRAATVEFWRAVEEGPEPAADYGRDMDTLRAVAMAGGDGPEVDLSFDNMLPELLDEKARIAAEATAIGKRQKEITGEILAKMAGAGVGVVADGRIITSKTVHRNGYTVGPTEYRDVRVKKGRA